MMTYKYTIKYSSKRKTLGLIVERDKTITVLAPEGVSEELVNAFVERRKMWLYDKLNFTLKFRQNTIHTPFVSGKSIMYLGKNYKLDITEQEHFEGFRFNNKFLLSKQNQERAEELLAQWYKRKAIEKLKPKIELYAQKLGVSYGKLYFSDLKLRWGSCSPQNNLNFNWKLIKAPAFVIDYIIIHELAHLIELNHTPAFWNIVQIQMPNYQEARTWLKNHGEKILV
ncbi:hypothetical protein SAMN05421780_1212 [Flexibacter flexilis DSM 6793]|uniref:YgjP-like metallopeptidase domain-containing protein n=1 Tax=Flexibacter flexilis DSM 6793 TaxID=927664 RepID=A0A1I1NW08_9BACT|nr:SprT family zinc-dependent metalloprotease [Flexibacter flexilis]SFD01522.1 hypothetical protein SAMN05421780_1212 [Flexibacter flexilis DSM 6793]